MSALGIVLASGLATGLAAQEVADRKACAQLSPAIESLKAMLVQEGKAALEASLRNAESEETDLRGALARTQAQMEAFDEAPRNAAVQSPDPERKAQRAEIDANLRGLIDKLESLVRARIDRTPYGTPGPAIAIRACARPSRSS